jgi:hypothetical protein
MPNSPGVSVSQIATQLEAFDQMRFELVSFQYGGWWPLSARVPWQRGMEVTSTIARTTCFEIIRIYPGQGASCFNPAQRSVRSRCATAAPLGRKSSFFAIC